MTKPSNLNLNNHLYLRSNVSFVSYESKINKLISGKTEEKKIRILEGIKTHTDKILKIESNKCYDAETELSKTQNYLSIITNTDLDLKDKIKCIYQGYLNKPIAECSKIDRLIQREILKTNVPAADSTIPEDIIIMKNLIAQIIKILNNRQEILQREMKEFNRRINICRDAIYFCDKKIGYLQNQIRNRKNAAQQKLNNAGQNVTGGQPAARASKPQPGANKMQAKNNSFFSYADKGEKEADEDGQGKYFIEKISGKVYKVYYKLDENGYAYPTGHTEEIEEDTEEQY